MSTSVSTQPRIKPQPSFAKILRVEERFSSDTSNERDVSEQINGWFDRLMIQSGLQIAPSVLLMLSLVSAIAVGGLIFVIQENFLTAALGAFIGFMIPLVSTVIARNRRQSKILGQMPGMLDELARAARTGRSLEHCLEIVSDDTPAPLGDEMRRSKRKMQLGLGVDEALRELPERTGVVSMNIFVMALAVHQETGGDLVRVLDRLARTIRDRLSFLGRLKAATAASRATAILMISVPPFVLLFFTLRDPDYLQSLMASKWARNATIGAIFLQIIGSIWVLRILKKSQRS